MCSSVFLTYRAALRCISESNPSVRGGLGGAVCELLSEKRPTPVLRVGVNDEFGRSGPAKELVSYFHLDAAAIAEKAKAAVALKK